MHPADFLVKDPLMHVCAAGLAATQQQFSSSPNKFAQAVASSAQKEVQAAEKRLAGEIKAADSTLHGNAQDIADKLPSYNTVLSLADAQVTA